MSSSADADRSPTLRFLGAAGTVTGSRFLLQTSGARVLIDAGLFQGPKSLRLRNWRALPVEEGTVDAVVLTHAHIDHSGYLPALGRNGFRGPIYATQGTAALCAIVLPDSGHLQEEDAAYANRRGFSKHSPAQPLYTEEDAIRVLRQFRPCEFGESVEVAKGVRATFSPAGHILGAASILLEYDGHRLLVSGDLGRSSHPILRAPAPPPAADFVLIESTYGDRGHEEANLEAEFGEAIARTAARGGAAVIPSFAVDRTEVILHLLRKLRLTGQIPPLPVYLDSPMALDTLRVYRRAIEAGDPAIRPDFHGDADCFDPGNLLETRTVEASKRIATHPGPAVIISASGMATGGRVLHHLAQRLPDPRNSVLLVGYQVEGTRGRALADGVSVLKLLGRYVPVRAEVASFGGFSAHADRAELLAWLGALPQPPQMVFTVHGEPAAASALRQAIASDLGWAAAVPRDLEIVRVD
jgi:metallo-beta-lactamase family protein